MGAICVDHAPNTRSDGCSQELLIIQRFTDLCISVLFLYYFGYLIERADVMALAPSCNLPPHRKNRPNGSDGIDRYLRLIANTARFWLNRN